MIGTYPNLPRRDKSLILVPSDCKSGLLYPLDLSSFTVLAEQSLLWRVSLDILYTVYREFFASGRCVKFSLSPIFAISKTLNEDVY